MKRTGSPLQRVFGIQAGDLSPIDVLGRPGKSRRPTGSRTIRPSIPGGAIGGLICAVLIVGVLAGCGGTRLRGEEAAVRVARAVHYAETIRSLETAAADSDMVADIREALERARTALDAGDFDGARRAADESVAISRAGLNRQYRETVVRLARRARDHLEARERRDPEDPLPKAIPVLDAIAARGGRLETDPGPVSIARVLADLETVLAVSDGIRESWRRTLSTDESFVSGTWELSAAGRRALDTLATEIRRSLSASGADGRRFHIKATGYTDSLDFGRDARMARRLSEGTEVPGTDLERRRFLNRRLSGFRAEAVARALAERLRADGEEAPTVEAVGRGEEPPADVLPPYPAADPRRRICRIFVHRTFR